MKKTAKMLLLTSALVTATAASVGALYKKTVKELMKIALDREEPRALQRDKDKLTGNGVNATALSEAINTVMQAAERLRNSESETVEITADDGIRPPAPWQPHDRSPSPARSSDRCLQFRAHRQFQKVFP